MSLRHSLAAAPTATATPARRREREHRHAVMAIDGCGIRQPADEKIRRPLGRQNRQIAAAKQAALAELAELVTGQTTARQHKPLAFPGRRLGLLLLLAFFDPLASAFFAPLALRCLRFLLFIFPLARSFAGFRSSQAAIASASSRVIARSGIRRSTVFASVAGGG